MIMAFEVQLAATEDVPQMAQVCQEAFDKDLMQHLCFVDVPYSVQYEGNRKHFEHAFSRECVHFFKAVDTKTGFVNSFVSFEAIASVSFLAMRIVDVAIMLLRF